MHSKHFERRLHDVRRFYELMAALEARVGEKRVLATAHGRMQWPKRGVYFFFEPGEERTTSGAGLRVTRVGTHALKEGSRSTLWGRLRQHRGTVRGKNPGSGNHRGSVFRLHVGTALINRDDWPMVFAGQWGEGSSASKHIREKEVPLERAVSQYMRRMPFLWLQIDDDPGPQSLRGYIERHAIALLSNAKAEALPIDLPSRHWLGHWAAAGQIRRSGMWNVEHVTDSYDPAFLDMLEDLIEDW